MRPTKTKKSQATQHLLRRLHQITIAIFDAGDVTTTIQSNVSKISTLPNTNTRHVTENVSKRLKKLKQELKSKQTKQIVIKNFLPYSNSSIHFKFNKSCLKKYFWLWGWAIFSFLDVAVCWSRTYLITKIYVYQKPIKINHF